MSLSELIDINDELTCALNVLENIVLQDNSETRNNPSVSSVVSLGRRLAFVSIPPTFVRFNTEAGPIESLPNRFHVPFPTLDDMRYSVLHSKAPIFKITHRTDERLPSASNQETPKPTVAQSSVPIPAKLPESTSVTLTARPVSKSVEPEDDEYADDF